MALNVAMLKLNDIVYFKSKHRLIRYLVLNIEERSITLLDTDKNQTVVYLNTVTLEPSSKGLENKYISQQTAYYLTVLGDLIKTVDTGNPKLKSPAEAKKSLVAIKQIIQLIEEQ